MKRELKDKKVVIRVTETQFKKLAESILDDKSISQFIREAIREKLKWFFLLERWVGPWSKLALSRFKSLVDSSTGILNYIFLRPLEKFGSPKAGFHQREMDL